MRAYLTQPLRPHRSTGPAPWGDGSVSYEQLHLLGRRLRWTMDVSGVGCGCLAAVYLVAMAEPTRSGSSYCDINTAASGRCLEIDLIEANVKAARVRDSAG